MKHIGLISAVPLEAAGVISSLKRSRSPRAGCTIGTIGGIRVTHSSSGIGLSNAARAAAVMAETFKPSMVIHFGIGGAYHGSGLKVGDIAVASEEVYADLGVIGPEGFIDLKQMGFAVLTSGRKKYYNSIPTDRGLTKAASMPGAVKGRFLTVNAASGTLKRASELIALFGPAICENMEGAAVAHICASYGLPMVELRGISNMVEDRDMKKWDIGLAADNVQRAVLALINSLRAD